MRKYAELPLPLGLVVPRMKKLSIILLLIVPEVFAQQVKGEVELAGFVLGQDRQTVQSALGAPFQSTKHEDGWLSDFHKIKPDTSVYVVFKYRPSNPSKIYGIELAGDPDPDMHPFKGLKLGANKEKVNQVLGNPDKTESIDDPPVTTYFYSHRNYSVDIDDRGLLFGIQIFGNILDQQAFGDPSVKGFKNAIVTRNIDSLLYWMTPDVEIHKGGTIYQYATGARNELNKPDSEFTRLLMAETGSVWFAFAKELADGTSESRLHPQLNQTVMVDKFFDSSTIAEIVFKPHAGRWKVFEVKFR
jgi:hypothetical protein